LCSLADTEHDVARLLAGLDVAGRLDDFVQLVHPVDHGPVLACVDELLDEDEVLLAIAADAELRTPAPDEPCDESDERRVIHEPEVDRDVEPAGLQRAPAALGDLQPLRDSILRGARALKCIPRTPAHPAADDLIQEPVVSRRRLTRSS
jgi:hypothetical protein